MARKLTQEIYDAYLNWIKKNEIADKAHGKMAKLIKDNCNDPDPIQQGQIVVHLTRVRLGTMTLDGRSIDKEAQAES
jgi:hypothetical protein